MPIDDSPTGHRPGLSLRLCAMLTVVSALFFALTSPFRAVVYLPFLARWAYWAALVAITASTYLVVWRVARPDRSKWGLALIVSLVSTPLVLVAILVVQQAIGRPVPTEEWAVLTASIWVINAALAALAAAFSGPEIATPASDKPEPPDAQAGIRQRLPVGVRDHPIRALNAQDHYLDVILDDSHHLIQMRLGDAVAMLAGEDGLQVHRSWWVAREAVAKIRRDGRRVEIELGNGQRVPVSRAGAARLKEVGWLA